MISLALFGWGLVAAGVALVLWREGPTWHRSDWYAGALVLSGLALMLRAVLWGVR